MSQRPFMPSHMTGSPLEVLLVEDNRADRHIIRQLLGEYDSNHHLNEVEDGEEALDFLNRRGKVLKAPPADLIFLDLNLPRIGGLGVLRQVKTHPAFQMIPVVVLTSSRSPNDVKAAYQAGANLYLRKPTDLQHLQELLRGLSQIWFRHAVFPKPQGTGAG